MKRCTLFALLFVLSFLPGFSVSGQTANFTADYTSGCAPLVVHFTNTSTGATSYSWNLGNSIISSLTDPSTSYLTTGTYTVTLTAYNGSSSSVHTMIITVYPTPTVNFYASDTAVCPGVPITFTSTTSSGVAGALTYVWNFGDGGSSTAAGPTHTFPGPGYYNITLAATNAQGCVSSLTKGAYIHVFTPASVGFNASSLYFCKPPANVLFTNTTTGTGPFSYAWSFGDGGTSAGADPSHTYSATGSYPVTLVVTDGDGCKDSLTKPGFVSIGSITAAFTAVTTACVNSSVVFDNTSSSHISSSWSFGDGGTSTSDTASHTYTVAGTYTVTLVIFNGSCYDTVSHTIIIAPGATASFTISPTNSCPAPATITFTGTVPGGATVAWRFGDGGTGSGATTTHTYTYNGADTVKMIVTNGSGCKDTITQVFELYNLRMDINHDTIPSGCVPLTVTFHCHIWTTVPDSVTFHPYPFPISSYEWTFGDGSPTTSGGVTIVHTYTAVGVYTCKVVITTSNGCTDSAYLTVLVGTPPVASFSATPTHICADRGVNFINSSTGATNYLWYFGDSTNNEDTNPTHIYTLPGTFTVMLIAFDNGCPDTFIRTNYIIVDSPSAIIHASYICNPRNEVAFADSSLGDNSHLWIFGDGATSTADDTVHFYPALSTYTVTLTTYNTASGCRDTATDIINLTKPVLSFTASDTAICRDQWVRFTPMVTGDSIISFAWYRDGLFRDDTALNYTDTFHVTGLHTITFVIQDSHKCYDTLQKNNYILVAKPVASFTVAPPSGCEPLFVTFTDNSTDVTGTFFTNYTWAFGDSASASLSTTPVSHTYTTVGTYSVQEIVTDNIGCKDTVIMPNLISVYKPHASFYANTTHPCPWQDVYFVSTSVGAVSSYWMFGDGATSTLTSPIHDYTAPGIYTVTLIVTDAHGCTDTAIYPNYITVTQPVASFSMTDSVSVCAPLSEVFLNTSTGATSYYWSFGDGNSSAGISPSDLYITAGYYTVMLIAVDPYGCKDTAIKHINIYGYAGAFTYTPDTGCTPLTVHFHAAITNVPSIIWDFADGSTSSASSTPDTIHIYTIPGGYVPKLILSDNTGCQSSSSGIDTIKVDAVTTGFKTVPEPVCQGGAFNFIDSSKSYWSVVTAWLWSYGGTTSTSSSPSYVYNAPGTYSVTLVATDAWGCKGAAEGAVIVYPPPAITVSPDTTICVGDAASLTAYGGITYTWAPPIALSCIVCNPTQASPAVATSYTVTGEDANGCTSYDTVTVFLKTQTVTVGHGDTAVCQGTKVPLWDSGATKFTWSPPAGLNNSTIANPIADPLVTTTYTVTAQLGSCIADVNYITVTVYPLPAVSAGPDQTLIAGSTAQLVATGTNITTYTWSPDATLSCSTCNDPVASMSVTTTYVVDVTSLHNCINEDSVTIHLYCNTSQVFIPNSFTPNGDGQNDVFYPRGTGISSIRSFRIYNRWGELLFERDNIQMNDASNAWDGTYGGSTPKPDVYVYIVDAICETGEPVFIKGDVTIIR